MQSVFTDDNCSLAVGGPGTSEEECLHVADTGKKELRVSVYILVCLRVCVRVCVRACVRASVRACVRACVHPCMHACVCV